MHLGLITTPINQVDKRIEEALAKKEPRLGLEAPSWEQIELLLHRRSQLRGRVIDSKEKRLKAWVDALKVKERQALLEMQMVDALRVESMPLTADKKHLLAFGMSMLALLET